MPDLSEKEREKLPDTAFAYIDRDGGRHLPIPDESHVRNAIARWGQTDFESKAAKERARRAIVDAAHRHHIEIDDDDAVARASD